ncbi:MAG: acyl carrier protein [Eubacteriales bacterium]
MIFNKIKEMLAEKLGCAPESITEASEFSELGLDSLDLAEMAMNVEEALGVSIELDASIDTVGALVGKIKALQA